MIYRGFTKLFKYDILTYLYLSVILLLIPSCHTNSSKDCNYDIEYEEWMLHPEDGVQLFVKEFGTGEPVLVIHGGFGAEHSYLLNAFSPLADQFHFILYDQRGSLRSQCPDSLITVANHIKDIEVIRQQSGLEKLTIVSHSMGGFLAMRYAATYPGRTNKLVLLASPPAKCNIDSLTTAIAKPASERWKRISVIKELVMHGVENDSGNYSDKERSIRNRIRFGAINLHKVSRWEEIKGGPLFYSAGAGNAATASMESDSWNFIQPIREQQIPVFIIHGDDDYLPHIYHNSWKDSIPNISFHLVENAGHCLWIDNYEDYKTALLDALNN